VARIYAGILGIVALLTSLAEGMVHTKPTEAILFGAWCSLLVFAAIGYVVGGIAGRIVEEAVAFAIQTRLAAETPTDTPETTASTT